VWKLIRLRAVLETIAEKIMSIIAKRRREETSYSSELLGRRKAFESATVAISKICEGSQTLAMLRGLRKCTFARVRCVCTNREHKFFCTPDAYASAEDIGESTEEESEADDDSESGSKGSYANSLDEAAPVELGKEVAVDKEAFEELFGDDIVYWVSVRAESYGAYELTKEKAQLLGLTEAKRIEYAGTSEIIQHQEGNGFGGDIREVPMIVPADRIFYYSGEPSVKIRIPKGAENIELQPGCFYGSTMEERRIGSSNSVPKWHALLMYTLKRRCRREQVTGSSEVLAVLEDVRGY